MVAHLATDPAGLDMAWRGMVTRALSLLVPAVAVLAVAADPLLSVFGPHYAATGTAVLVLSAASAPSRVSTTTGSPKTTAVQHSSPA